jgi:hypothetical protein
VRWFALALMAIAAGCSEYPPTFAPPLQRLPVVDDDSLGYRHFHEMNDRRVETYFVQDIYTLEGNSWRWTGPKPTLRYRLREIQNLRFVMDLTVPEVTFRETGPVTVAVRVNGHLLDTVRYTAAGDYQFVKPVDEAWLTADEETIVEASVEPTWLGADGGTRLGFVLQRAGFLME